MSVTVSFCASQYFLSGVSLPQSALPFPFLTIHREGRFHCMDTYKQCLWHADFVKSYVGILEHGMLDFSYESNFVVLLLKEGSIFIGNNEHYSWIEKVFPKVPYWTGKVTKGSVITGDVRFMLLSEIKMEPNWLWWDFFRTNKWLPQVSCAICSYWLFHERKSVV